MTTLDPVAERLIEEHLDALGWRLGRLDRNSRHLLQEAGDHLYADTSARIMGGADPVDAAQGAIAAFGDSAEVTGARRRPVRRLVATAWVFGALGLLAVGLSGLLAAAFGSIWGWQFVAGDPSGLQYSASRCAEYLAITPDALDCRAAALVDHYSEVVDQRVIVGVLGILLMLAFLAWRRRGGPGPSLLLLSVVAMVSFGLAGLGQLVAALTAASLDQGMVGALLAGGIVACAFAAACIPPVIRSVQRSIDLA